MVFHIDIQVSGSCYCYQVFKIVALDKKFWIPVEICTIAHAFQGGVKWYCPPPSRLIWGNCKEMEKKRLKKHKWPENTLVHNNLCPLLKKKNTLAEF